MQTYLKNGYIVSMDQQDTVFDGGGVLVEDDRITAVGKVDPRLVKPDAEVIDLQGRYVLPGFVNTHVHTSQQISRGVGDDVDFICWLHDRMWPFESSMTEEDSYVSTLMTSLELIRSGVTSFAEPGGQFVSGMARGTAESGLRGKLAKSVMDCGEGLPEIWQRTMEQELEQQVADLEKFHNTADGRVQGGSTGRSAAAPAAAASWRSRTGRGHRSCAGRSCRPGGGIPGPAAAAPPPGDFRRSPPPSPSGQCQRPGRRARRRAVPASHSADRSAPGTGPCKTRPTPTAAAPCPIPPSAPPASGIPRR